MKRATQLESHRLTPPLAATHSLARQGEIIEIGSHPRYDAPPAPAREASRFGGMVGTGAAMRPALARLQKLAASNATVIIEGETGTGKTMAARAIHAASGRASQPFVVFDCGSISPTLIETELFGHERGAFTSAGERRIGALEEANGGTLFLDEIGELPLALQTKLLGALEERTIRRVGSSIDVPLDVRVLAATNRDLRAEVTAGRFRNDLYFRIAVLCVALPPLRERSNDIALIARQFLLEFGASAAQTEAMLCPTQMAKMQRCAWPGNVRELRNYIERCVVLDETLELPSELAGSPAAESGLGTFAEAKREANLAFERRYLLALLAAHSRVAEAAMAANIDRTHLYRLLRRHKIKA